ncbi:hypothetical protein [Saccharibacillus qingshengii]|uniref:hypothetical protein n=1 Tax=Saccharibacillus qingshengii TaxID=1763540 RepID=UPI0015576DFE|nr:hypothetical protein [Saccharibacillus qingshengii]
MQLSDAAKQEMRLAFERCRAVISNFPAPYAGAGILYLNRFDPDLRIGSTNYICLLLPYWLQQAAEASTETCRKLADANVFGMLHFHLQDERIDRAAGSGRTHIALSQLLNAEMNIRYASLFSSSSSFGEALRLCTAEWASGLAAEREPRLLFEQPQAIAARSAPLLLGPLVLFEDNESWRRRALHAVRETLVTLQMADDWADYVEDLREGSANCLVSFYRREYAVPEEVPVTAAEIDDAVYVRGLLGPYAEFAAGRQRELEAYREDFPGLIDFHAALAGDLERIAAGIEQEKNSLSLGGFNYWLLGREEPRS